MTLDGFKLNVFRADAIVEDYWRMNTQRFMNNEVKVGKIAYFFIGHLRNATISAVNLFPELFLSILVPGEL